MSALFGGRGGRRSDAPHLDDGLLVLGAVVVGSGGVPHPFDVGGGFTIHRAAVDRAGVDRWRCHYHAENGEGKHSSQSGHVASFWLGLPLLSEIRGNDARAKTVRTQRMFLFPLSGSLRRWVKS